MRPVGSLCRVVPGPTVMPGSIPNQRDAGVRGTPKKGIIRWGEEEEEGWEELGVLGAAGWYLLSGGDGDPPDAVHVGRVAVGEFGGGEVALAVLERLPTGCRGGKVGVRPPGSPRYGWHWVRSSCCSHPSLHPFTTPRTSLQKKKKTTPKSPKLHLGMLPAPQRLLASTKPRGEDPPPARSPGTGRFLRLDPTQRHHLGAT